MLKEKFKWNKYDFVKATIGMLFFAIALNVFIVPNGLYNSGVLGISQLIRTLLISLFNINANFDFAGIIYLLLNIPLFILAYKNISKPFVYRTIYCVIIETLFITFIPHPDVLLVKELITSVIIGGVLAGVGCGLVLSASASGGGTEIIGIVLTNKNSKLSVGKISLLLNVLLFITCGILYGYVIMIYSIIYALVFSLMVDKMHDQNNLSTAIIFTKEKPTTLIKYIKEKLHRDVTHWEAVGAHDNTTTYICYVVLSRYELQNLERDINEIDENAFLVKGDITGTHGNFKKVLINDDNTE